ncbi:FAD:protein FMN transferase [Noviherbaspirillum sp. DKR-6]|uniref:FAD:protein FMN transferase n=2 Tax=Noviherbaspirillum pedocola TaxID=2801341 RepID=A0A934W8Z6_9BURK|nr:FAD:protein FMN transferase [Noviherbaspirillum pedocola]
MRRAQPWLGTVVDITIADGDSCEPAMRAAFTVIADVHRLMSFHDAHSDVSRINRAEVDEQILVDARTAEVLEAALALCADSGGLFNPFCAPLLVEWDYLPAPDARNAPDWRAGTLPLVIDGCRVKKLAPAWIDLGGIAKGYAVDAATEALRAHGVRAGCVNAGGDMRGFGDIDWPVLLRDAQRPQMPAFSTQLRDGALATSAIYFSGRTTRGQATSALVHGASGKPLLSGGSVSVAASRCMLADALTKVVAASGNAEHPLLAAHAASAFVVAA